MFAVIIIFLISSKLHSWQINRPKKLATHLYTFIHLFISHKGEKIMDISGKHGKKSDEQAKQL